MAPGIESPYTLLHEIGHQLDYALGQGPAGWRIRAKWLAIMHDTRSWGTNGAALTGEPNPPREQFAESFTFCAHRLRLPRRLQRAEGAYNWRPTRFQYAKVCALLSTGAAAG
jgi:hypothetical protein